MFHFLFSLIITFVLSFSMLRFTDWIQFNCIPIILSILHMIELTLTSSLYSLFMMNKMNEYVSTKPEKG